MAHSISVLAGTIPSKIGETSQAEQTTQVELLVHAPSTFGSFYSNSRSITLLFEPGSLFLLSPSSVSNTLPKAPL